MTPFELFKQLNELDEHPRIEAKTASAVGKSLLETVCAFANEPGIGGGWLLLGVAPDGQGTRYKVSGITDVDKIQNDLVTQCATMFNIPIRPQIQVATEQGHPYLAVFIEEMPASVKPVFFKKDGLPRGAFRRIGASDVCCTSEDLALLFQAREPVPYEISIPPDVRMDEVSPAAIAEYRRLRREFNPNAEELNWTDEELLRSLHCVATDSAGTTRPTVVGILMFGSTLALRRHFPMIRVDYIRMSGRTWIEDPHNRFDSIEIREPLARAMNSALQAILADLPKSFSLPEGSLQRQDIPVVPVRVLREAVVNALTHRSYLQHSPIQIIRYSNRLEIRNPGYSLISEELWGNPGSKTRNPQLAAIFHEINLAETKGSGIRVMRQLMRESGLTPPTFESSRDNDHFVTTLLFHHFLSPDDLEWIGSLSVTPPLTDEEVRALIYVREKTKIDNEAYRDINETDTLAASQHLRRLRDQGLLEQQGRGSATFYIPTNRFWETSNKITAKYNTASAGQPVNPGTAQPVNLHGREPVNPGTAQPVNLHGREPVNPGTAQPVNLHGREPVNPGTAQPVNQKLEDAFPELPKDIFQRLPKPKQRIRHAEMVELVRVLCACRELNANELSILLNRNRNYLTNQIITPMLRRNLLQMVIPSHPNHPEQTYRTPASLTN